MPTLHIANCTRQQRQVNYRLDMNSDGVMTVNPGAPHKFITVQPAKTAQLNLQHSNQAKMIIDQLAGVGGVDVSDIERLQRGKTTPYLFSVDKPITLRPITKVYNHNRGVISNSGEARRENAAIAANAAVEQQVGVEDVKQFELTLEGVENAEDTKDVGFKIDKTATKKK
jgi:hypothetical protein